MDSSYGGEDTVTKPAESIDRETAEADTTIVPNKILSPEGEPIKPGDEIVLQVVENFGEESSVKYAPKKEGDGESYSDEESESGTDYESELKAMDQE